MRRLCRSGLFPQDHNHQAAEDGDPTAGVCSPCCLLLRCYSSLCRTHCRAEYALLDMGHCWARPEPDYGQTFLQRCGTRPLSQPTLAVLIVVVHCPCAAQTVVHLLLSRICSTLSPAHCHQHTVTSAQCSQLGSCCMQVGAIIMADCTRMVTWTAGGRH